MFELRFAEHEIRPGVSLIEVIENGEVVAGIYPTDTGFNIMSRYLLHDPESAVKIVKPGPPPLNFPAIQINLHRKGKH